MSESIVENYFKRFIGYHELRDFKIDDRFEYSGVFTITEISVAGRVVILTVPHWKVWQETSYMEYETVGHNSLHCRCILRKYINLKYFVGYILVISKI
jgi:hypothetical protein